MHSRCCWPPDSCSAGALQVVGDLVVQAGAAQRVDHGLLELGAFAGAGARAARRCSASA